MDKFCVFNGIAFWGNQRSYTLQEFIKEEKNIPDKFLDQLSFFKDIGITDVDGKNIYAQSSIVEFEWLKDRFI